MVSGPLVGMAPFEPINQVTPFTYRDNDTYLTILYNLKDFVNAMVDYVNDNFTESTNNLNSTITTLQTQISDAITTAQAHADTGDAAITASLNSQMATINNTLATFDQRLTDMYAQSNAGLNDRMDTVEASVTDAESKVSTYLSRVAQTQGYADPVQTPTEMLAGMADTQFGSNTIAIASDSTANDLTDWVRIWMQMFNTLLTNSRLRKIYNSWNATSQAWNTPIVDAPGITIPQAGGVILSDNFSRTGEVVGSVPNSGPVWIGKTGVWSADGNYAKQVATNATGALAIKAVNGYGNPIKNCSISAYMTLVTSASAAAQQYRFQVGSPIMTSDNSGMTGGVYVTVAVSASGAVTAGLYSLINGVNTTIALFPTIPGILAANATPQALTVSVTVNSDRTVSGTIQKDGNSAVSVNGSVSESDYAWMGGYCGVVASTLATPGYQLDSINISSPVQPAPAQPGLTIWNGGVAGATLLYHKSRLSTMFPNKPDILIISIGHNYADLSASEFTAIVDDFISACNTQWGSLPKILICSQNPEGPSAVNRDNHARRQSSLRQYAASKGYQYLPVFELFQKLPATAINADDIHPTVPAAYPLAAGDNTVYGSVEWAKLMQNYVTSRQYTAS